MSKLLVLLVFFATLQLSQAIRCWYGSDQPEESVYKLRSKHDDYCILRLSHDKHGKPITQFFGQVGTAEGVDLAKTGVQCLTVRTGDQSYHTQCFCNHSYCNNFSLLEELTGDRGRW